MPHSSKRKGNRYEREIVEDAEAKGLEAERAFASNGRALGEQECVDLLIRGRADMVTDVVRIQAKRRKSIAQYLTPPEGADVTVIREDRGQSLVVCPLDEYLDLLRAKTDET